MKNTILITVCLLIFQFALQAQVRGPKGMRQRVEAQRVAFMTQKMDLTPEESAAFWPLYNAYKKAQRELRDQIESNRGDFSSVSDEEADLLLNQVIAADYQQVDLKKSYIGKFKSVLPAKKILMIQPLEKAFNREILKKLRD